jgi:uncharacterized protein YicC (UPF0701 family)
MPDKDILGDKAVKALKEAIQELIEERAREGGQVVIWRNGRVAKVPAKPLLNNSKNRVD